MELYEHVFYTFAQGAAHNVDLSVARSMHVNSLNLAPGPQAVLLNKIANVCYKKYNRLCDVYDQYTRGEIDKGSCLALFKSITQEVM